jgi:hypothetical protein
LTVGIERRAELDVDAVDRRVVAPVELAAAWRLRVEGDHLHLQPVIK